MNQRKTKLLGLLCCLCAAGAAVSLWGLYRELKPRVEAESFYDEVRAIAFPAGKPSASGGQAAQGKPPASGGQVPADGQGGAGKERSAPDWEALRAWNPDIRGWIYSPGTVIDYPVVQGTDNDWYLNRTADQKKSIIGSIFLESGNRADFSDDVSVIYGHHIRGGRMFTPVSGYKDSEYYKKHPVMYLYTPEADYRVELFASDILDGKTGSFPLNFSDEKEREEWLNVLNAGGTFSGAAVPQIGERILALCTCTYEYQDARYTVYGVLKKLNIDEDEDEERRTQDEKDSENNGAGAVLPDDVPDAGDDGTG